MRRTAFYPLVAVSLLTISVFATHLALAASPVPGTKILTITPATTKPSIKPGASSSGKFQIINQGTGDYPVHIYAAPYTVHGEEYTPDFTPVPGKPNAASWLQFAVTQANILPNQTLDVPYTVTVPAGTAPGGYYAVAFAETKSSGSGHQGVIINERVGEIFYIQVAGKVHQAGKLLSWSSKFWQQPPLSASLRLENDGSLDYASNVTIVVRDIFGRAKYSLNTSKEVLPQTIRHVPISWSGAPPLGLFKVTGTITLPGNITKGLPTKYVLVMSPLVRITGIAVVAILVAYGFGRRLSRMRRSKKTAA
ncbi:MAG TPA: hypothetical protein VLF69_04720 [Candidatus Saccharimonadales bacterium]|nr:hypothetical protein [Candidatus Saccharimonadales bacterium]